VRVSRGLLIAFACWAGACFGADTAELSGRPVAFVGVRGAEAVSPTTLRSLLEINVGDSFDEDEAVLGLARIRNHYAESGYFLASATLDGYVLSSRADSASLVLTVSEGPHAVFGAVEIIGDSSLSGGTGQYVSVRSGDVYSSSAVEADVSSILEAYDGSAYPFARIAPEVVAVHDDGSLDVRLTVMEGPRVVVTDVRFPGRRRVHREVYARRFSDVVDREYDGRRVSNAIARLRLIPSVREVAEPQVLLRNDGKSVVISVPVVEKSASRAEGLLGYAPGEGDADGELIGLADLHLGNLFGTDRRARLRWSHPSRGDEDLSFSYTEPWLFGYPLDVDVGFEQSRRDSQYSRTRVTLGLSARLTHDLGGSVSGSWSRLAPPEEGVRTIDPARRYSVSLAGEYSSFDSPYNPSRGTRADASVEYARRRSWTNAGETGANETTVHGGGAVAFPVKTPHLLYFAAGAGAVTTSAEVVPIDLRFRLGGLATLRGYPDERFPATHTAWGRVEYRYRVDARSYVAAFVDGAVWRNQTVSGDDVFYTDDAAVGGGFGLRAGAGAYVAALDYAWGRDATLTGGVVHIGLIAEF
jgi:translocation and assembly module TamA